jgi:hypothetical protein
VIFGRAKLLPADAAKPTIDLRCCLPAMDISPVDRAGTKEHSIARFDAYRPKFRDP